MNPAAIADRMRTLLSLRGRPPEDAAETAARWAALIADAQQRLERAVAWAARGLRTEALGMVTAAPSLAEIAAQASDPALVSWDDYCRRHGFERPPTLAGQALDRLNGCSLDLAPLQAALARWRKLNIGRASAIERLEQMRTLRRLDPENQVWIDDAPALEQAALAEVMEASERALALWELDRVNHAIHWIESGQWIAAPARAAAAALRQRVRELSGRSALDRARSVVERLHAEYMAESIDAAESHLKAWEALRRFLAESGVELPTDLAESVRPVEDWIRERQEASQRLIEHRSNEAELRALVDAPTASLEACERLLRVVEQGPGPVDPRLRAAAVRRIRALRRVRALRRAVLVAACLGVAAGLLLSSIWIIERHRQSKLAEHFLAQVDAAIARDDLELAESLIDRRVAEEPRLAATATPAEAHRRVALARAERIRNDAAFEAGLAEAGDPSDPRAMEAVDLESLAALARTTEQRVRLDQWRHARQQAELQRQQARDLAFAAALADLEQAVAALAAGVESPVDAARQDGTALRELRLRLDALESSPGISAPALVRARPVRMRLEGLEQAREQALALERARAQEALEIEGLLWNLRDSRALAEALRRFGESRPSSPHAEGFLDAAMDEPAWRAVLAWHATRASIAAPIASLDEAHRADARRALRAFADTYPRSIHADTARNMLQFLEPAGEWRRWLAGVLDSSPLLQLRSVRLRNGERYYYEESQAPQPGAGGTRVYRIVKRLRDPARGGFDSEFLSLDPRQIEEDGDSPQRLLARSLRASMLAGHFEGVEGLLAVLAQVRDATAVDAVLRAELAAGLLERLSRAAPVLEPRLAEASRRLADARLGRIDWLDPRSIDARDRSRDLDAALPRLLETQSWLEAWRVGLARAEEDLSLVLEPVGLMLRGANEAEVSIRWDRTPAAGELLVVRAGGDRPDRLLVAGHVDEGGERTMHGAIVATLPSGTPLFQRRAAGRVGAAGGAGRAGSAPAIGGAEAAGAGAASRRASW